LSKLGSGKNRNAKLSKEYALSKGRGGGRKNVYIRFVSVVKPRRKKVGQ